MNLKNSPSPEKIRTAPTNVTLKCAVCHARFTNRSAFFKHYALHKEDKAFSCNICNKKFSERSKLDSHYVTHRKICTEKFVCNVCNKTFTERKKYDVHYAIHTKPQTLSCNICNKSFFDRSKLDAHYLSHQAVINTYDCNKCSRKFLYNNQLEQHMKFHTLHINNKEKQPVRESSVCIENFEKEKESDSENDEPVKVTLTRSGRKVRFKRFYAVDDQEDGKEDELSSKRCKNSDISCEEETEKIEEKSCSIEVNEKVSNEKVICDNQVSVACINLSVVSEKLPEDIYKKCTENGSISVRSLAERSCLESPRQACVKNIKTNCTQRKKRSIPVLDNQASKESVKKLPVGIKEKEQKILNSSHLYSLGHRETRTSSAIVCKETKNFTTTDNRTLYMGPNQSVQKIKEHVQTLYDIVHEKSDSSKTNVKNSGNKQETKQIKNELSANVKNAIESTHIKKVTNIKKSKNDDAISIKNMESGTSIAETLCQTLATPGKKIQIMQVLNPNVCSNSNNFILPDSLKSNKDSSIKPNDGVISSAVVNNNIRIVQVTPELMQMMQKSTLGLNILNKQKASNADKHEINGNVSNDSAVKSNLGVEKNTPVEKCSNHKKNVRESHTNSHMKSTLDRNSLVQNDISNSPFKSLMSRNHHTYSKMIQSSNTAEADCVQPMSTSLPGTRGMSASQCLADKNIVLSSNDPDKGKSVLKEIAASKKNLSKPNMQEILMKEKVLIKLIEKMKEKEAKKKRRYELKKHMRYIEAQIFNIESPEHSVSETRKTSENTTVKNANSVETSAKTLCISEVANDLRLSKLPYAKTNYLVEESNVPTVQEQNAVEKPIALVQKEIDNKKNMTSRQENSAKKSLSARQEENSAKKNVMSRREENSAKNNVASRQEENSAKNNVASRQEENRAKNNVASRQEENSAKNNVTSRQEENSAKNNVTSRQEENSAKNNVTSIQEEKNAKKDIHNSRNKLSLKSKKTTITTQNDEYSSASIARKEANVVSCPSNKGVSSCSISSLKTIDSKKAAPKVKVYKSQSKDHNLPKNCDSTNGEIKVSVQSSSIAEGSKTVTNVSDDSKRESASQKSDLKAVKRIMDIDKRIKISLNVSNLNIGACLEAMNELDELAITSRIWKKCLIVLKTLKTCRRFTKSETVRKKACDLYDKFTKYYIISAVPPT